MKENNIFNLEYNTKMTPSQKSRLKKKIELWNKPTNVKSIVVWGTNLTLGVSDKRILERHVYHMYSLNKYHLSVLTGLLLGDGWMVLKDKTRSVNARFGLYNHLKSF